MVFESFNLNKWFLIKMSFFILNQIALDGYLVQMSDTFGRVSRILKSSSFCLYESFLVWYNINSKSVSNTSSILFHTVLFGSIHNSFGEILTLRNCQIYTILKWFEIAFELYASFNKVICVHWYHRNQRSKENMFTQIYEKDFKVFSTSWISAIVDIEYHRII